MNSANNYINQLYSIRNRYGKQFAVKKMRLLYAIHNPHYKGRGKRALQAYYDALLFIIAYPDNKAIYTAANDALAQLQSYIGSKENLRTSLYNSGVTGSAVCAAFGFEMVKWLRKTHSRDITLSSFEASNAQIQAILSVVMPKVESEILQDANAEWRGWLKRSKKDGEDMLDQLVAIFASTTIRPEVKDELWNAIGVNTEINLSSHCSLPPGLVIPYYHRSLRRKNINDERNEFKATRITLNKFEAEEVLDCSRMVLIRHLREIDSISFSAPALITYYQLSRGLSIALMSMVAARRHPIDSYMGYVVFKNGLPVAYAGSWIMFDSARISLNVFPAYRGGESQYIFQQAMQLHRKVYGLKRFSVDPYQIGKENSDGIKSGSFWVYYHAGFRPLLKAQQELAETEARKLATLRGYRSSKQILVKLADSRMQLTMDKSAIQIDATDLSLLWLAILKKKYDNDRVSASADGAKKLAAIIQLENWREDQINFVLENWAIILLANENELRENNSLKRSVKKLIELKAEGREENYIHVLQKAAPVRKFLERLLTKQTQ